MNPESPPGNWMVVPLGPTFRLKVPPAISSNPPLSDKLPPGRLPVPPAADKMPPVTLPATVSPLLAVLVKTSVPLPIFVSLALPDRLPFRVAA